MRVGFSTGFLTHKIGKPLKEVLNIYSNARAKAIELSLMSYEETINFQLNPELIQKINNFSYISIHAPCKGIIYKKDQTTIEVLNKLKSLSEELNVQAVVLHPSVIQDFTIFEEYNLPFLIENMDKRNEKLTIPEHFKKFKKESNLGFVLDLQHAYEHDPTMKLAQELVEVMGSNLKELHVSGQTQEQKHSLLHLSENKTAIEKILKKKFNLPIILEGCPKEPFQETAQKEITYIKSFYN